MYSHADAIAIFGDVGGQADAFIHHLQLLGVNPEDMTVPDGLLILQVGDLVSMTGTTTHRNRQAAVLAARLLEANPGRYIQLIGNHELAALGGIGRPGWTEEEDPGLGQLLRSLGFTAAVGVLREGQLPLLATHAGVTYGRWNALGSPSIEDLVGTLNADARTRLLDTRRPGRLVTGRTNVSADEQWAEVNFELYQPWLNHPSEMPWVQVHGHASPWSWSACGWWPETPDAFKRITSLDHASRISRTTNGRSHFVSVNWELTDRDAAAAVAPLVIQLGTKDSIII